MFEAINGWTVHTILERIASMQPGQCSESGTCVYYRVDGDGNELRCVAGMFIPEHHAALHARNGVGPLMADYPELRSLFPLDSDGMVALQEVHDLCAQVRDMDGNILASVEPEFAPARQACMAWVQQNVVNPTEAGTIAVATAGNIGGSL